MTRAPEQWVGPNALTIDVEEYFHATAFAGTVANSHWDSLPSRVESSTAHLLDLLAEYDIKATFFILGWVAERHPALIRRIHSAGHEIGCHSQLHRLVYDLTEAEFRRDTARAKSTLESLISAEVPCYRAPSFSIVPRSRWALRILVELGFTSDCSIAPVMHDLYGFPGSPLEPAWLQTESGRIAEFPISTVGLFGKRVGICGGGYLRLLPRFVTRILANAIRDAGRPVMTYVHPWELDPEQPRLQAPLRSRLRHYSGLATMEGKVRAMLDTLSFAPVSTVLALSLPGYSQRAAEVHA